MGTYKRTQGCFEVIVNSSERTVTVYRYKNGKLENSPTAYLHNGTWKDCNVRLSESERQELATIKSNYKYVAGSKV